MRVVYRGGMGFGSWFIYRFLFFLGIRFCVLVVLVFRFVAFVAMEDFV